MSTDGLAYGEQLPVRRGPAYGEAPPPPKVEATEEDAGPLDRRTEAFLALTIVTPIMAAYGAMAYGAYLLVGSIF